jgi:hypothetical protein
MCLKFENMKKVMFLLVCCVFSLAIFAQDSIPAKTPSGNKEMKTIFGKNALNCKIPF